MPAPWPRATNKSTALVRLMQQTLPDVIVRDDYVQWFFDDTLLQAIRKEPLSRDFKPTNDYERFTQISYRYIDLREKHFDTVIQESIARGSRQVVSLGAGFDTRCLRLPELKTGSVRLFETDRPETVQEKTAVLKSRLGGLPAGLTLIPLDLNAQELESIRGHGFDPLLPTTFVMQGLLFYLPQGTVSSLLPAIRRIMGAGSLLAFDSCSSLMTRPNDEIPGISEGIRRLAEMGEPFLFGMDAPEMERWLAAMQFGSIQVTQQDELEVRLLGKKTIPGNMWYVVSARP
jgi:methyltransferase (TIGR00027 family)